MTAVFLGSFFTDHELPKKKGPRVAFLGRSNVGKSSLINLLTDSTVARVSKTPGKTQALNLYEIDTDWIIGDFPGYGFARVSRDMKRKWGELIQKFLKQDYFQYAVHIVDARHPAMETDVQMQRWLEDSGLRYQIVLNKSDKLNRKERMEADREAHKAFPNQPLLFASAFSKEGKRELEQILRNFILSNSPRRVAKNGVTL